MAEVGWSVRDLAELAGTTVRTVHYYISEGLLPPPAGATRSATYSPAHLARLRLVAALRDEGLALANIRQRLAPLSDEQAIEVVDELDLHLSQAGETPLTTLGLIEGALASRNVAEKEAPDVTAAPSRPVVNYSVSLPFEAREQASGREQRGGSAGDYLNRLLREPSSTKPAPPIPMPRPKPPARKRHESDRPEAWYHFHVEDGIELRVREDRYRESKGRLQAVIDTLRTMLRRYGLARNEQDRD